MYTKEQAAQVLKAHEQGFLVRFGRGRFRDEPYDPHCYGCINQHAFGPEDPEAWRGSYSAWEKAPVAAEWFDRVWEPSWTREQFREQLVNQGIIPGDVL